MWKRIVKSCGGAQIVGSNVLFLGPSNTIGLGSVWRKTNTGGYNPRFELSSLVADEATRQQIIKLGQKTEMCKGTSNNKWNFGVSLPFVGGIFGLTGIDADLRRARRATVTADSVALDVILEVPFEVAIKKLRAKDPEDPFLVDLLTNPDRLLVSKAYRITGMAMTFDYDPKLLEELKGKYPEGFSVNIGGEKGLKVGFNYSSESSLTLKLPSEVYVAGEFSKITTNGTINLGESTNLNVRLRPVRVSPNTSVGKVEPLPTRKP